MTRNVTVIPPTINLLTHLPSRGVQKRRVAGYARVSTDSEEQKTSYDAQVDYYTSYIQSRADWEFVRVYTDEGISATNTRKREGFNEMVSDALAGKIDLIVTKSVSRFARNTVDSLVTVRKLKEKGIEVYFEKENIFTLDSKGELLITIMSSLAQEESRSISENITWGQRKRFSDGKVSMPYKRFLGYQKGENGNPIINEEEAKTVRLIYGLFLSGKTPASICKELETLKILSPSGNEKWSKTTINSILTNEKYKGDALLQKTFTVDFLQKKIKVNEGEVQQYYVERSHPPIIEPEEWDLVQSEIARRKSIGKAYSGNSTFSTRLICEDCNNYYGRKLWHSTDNYRRFVWHCNGKFSGNKCKTPTLDETQIQKMFLTAYNKLMKNQDSIIADCELMRASLADLSELESQMEKWQQEINYIAGLVKACVKDNATSAQSQDEYDKKYGDLVARYEDAVHIHAELSQENDRQREQIMSMTAFIENLKEQPIFLTEWNDTIWSAMIDKCIVHKRGSITFIFKSGAEIEVESD